MGQSAWLNTSYEHPTGPWQPCQWKPCVLIDNVTEIFIDALYQPLRDVSLSTPAQEAYQTWYDVTSCELW